MPAKMVFFSAPEGGGFSPLAGVCLTAFSRLDISPIFLIPFFLSRTCLGVTLVQGYSLTESCCTGTVMENADLSTGTVGKPMTGVEVRLVDWEEGNYKVIKTKSRHN